MGYDWFENLQNKSGSILEKLPEITLPGIIYITSALRLGADEFAILMGLYFANVENKKVAVFVVESGRIYPFDDEELVSKCKESKNLNIYYASCEFEIKKTLKIIGSLDVIIFIYPDTLYSNYPIQHDLYYDEIYKIIDDVSSNYKIPIILTGRLNPCITGKRIDHTPVIYDIPNWNLIQGFFHTIIFLHRDSYYNGRFEEVSTTFIVEKSPTIRKRKFTV